MGKSKSEKAAKGKVRNDSQKKTTTRPSALKKVAKEPEKVEFEKPLVRVKGKSSPSTVSTTSSEGSRKKGFVYSTPPKITPAVITPPVPEKDGSKSKKRTQRPPEKPTKAPKTSEAAEPPVKTKVDKKEKKSKKEKKEKTETAEKKTKKVVAEDPKPSKDDQESNEGSSDESDVDKDFDDLCKELELIPIENGDAGTNAADDASEESDENEEDEEEEEEEEDSDQGESDEDEAEEGAEEGSSEESGSDSDSEASAPDAADANPTDAAPAGSNAEKPSAQLVAAANGAVALPDQQQMVLANSVSHKKEYDQFCREIVNRKKCPVSLGSHLEKDKNDIFNLWLQSNKDLKQVAVLVERRAEKLNRTRSGRQGMKERDLLTKYGSQEKVDKLKELLNSRGMWEWDSDFPNDPEEIYWFAGTGKKITSDDITAEKIAISGKEKNPSAELVEAITSETGPLTAGALPATGGAGAEADKHTWDSVLKTSTAKAKAKPVKKNAEQPEEVIDAMDAILSQGGEARKMSLALKHVAYSGELTNQMMTHSQAMENIYAECQDLIAKNEEDEKPFKKIAKKFEAKNTWFEKAKAAGSALLAGLTGSSKKRKGPKSKAAAKAKSAAEPSEGKGK